MKQKISLIIIAVWCCLGSIAIAQNRRCGTMHNLEKAIAKDPSVLLRMQQSENQIQERMAGGAKFLMQRVTIPVVVHVVWHKPVENISDAQIQSQIDILNEDFRLKNSDSLDSSHPFWPYTMDTNIDFCLAKRTPNGISTTGITRTYTDSVSFIGEGNEKSSATGGKDNWDPTQYLNLWVCNLDASDGTLGYAVFPGELTTSPELDGVVIRYEAFGNIGTAGDGIFTTNNLGRTATHEVGHWLNLRHIWGDDVCGDDFVSDTPPAKKANYGCPNFPFRANSTCGSDQDGEMFMNYMDYVDDPCMNMFTYGQAKRIQTALSTKRTGLLTSQGGVISTNETELLAENSVSIFPNPSNGNFKINLGNYDSKNVTIQVVNVLGSTIQTLKNISGNIISMNLSELSNGIYYLSITRGDEIIVKKINITK